MRCLSRVHPLAGAATWTWEVIFRPDADGARRIGLSSIVVGPGHEKDIDDRLCLDKDCPTGSGAWIVLP